MKRLVLTMVVGLGLGGSACATPGQPVHLAGGSGQVEAIQGAAFTRDTVLLKVSSNGCTDRDDIKPIITKLRSRTVVTLHRLEEDVCADQPADGVILKWSFDELGLEPGTQVEVNNPYMLPDNVH